MSVSETTGQAGSSGQTNLKVEIGVPRAADANIVSIARVLEIGVPTNNTLISADNQPKFVADNRTDTDPVGRGISARGIGVPFNPANGITSE